ncbi:MAG TPA: DUF2231 domain-containing protein [Gemmatimonadaceae bacterium]
MNLAHLHLMLNHGPVIGAFIAFAVLAVGWARGRSSVIRTGYWIFAASAALAVVVYLTGEPAEDLVKKLPGFSEQLAEHHEEIALASLIALGVVGLIALGALYHYRGREIPRRIAGVTVLLGLVPVALMAWTANTGGQIRHTEIRAGQSSAQSATP